MAVDMIRVLRCLENPTYFMCGRRDIPKLTKKAKEEAEEILREFSMFFPTARPLSIEIYICEYAMCYSIGARLVWDGKTVIQDESSADLLFLSLNECILKRMIELGFPSRIGAVKDEGVLL